MSLDKNLFTLTITPHKDNPNVIDLVDPLETVHYRKQRIPGSEYKVEVYDPSSESLLATVTAPSAASKTKSIELCNPTSVVELKYYTGIVSSRWAFKWEEHEFEWKKEECFIIRKPDPPVNVAVTREPSGKVKTQSVQLLDYNLNRFDINDRKGLEIVILTALLTFGDSNDAATATSADSNLAVNTSNNALSRASSALASAVSPSSGSGGGGFGFGKANGNPPPLPPPKPAPKTGVDRIAELQAIKGEYNEIVVGDEGSVEDYAAYCNNLLQDDAMLFISLKSAEAEQVPKVLQVVEETKRIRHKAGLDEDEELRQYVLYDQKEQKKGPKIINLDDDKKNKYAPPKNLTVHLSKIDMPELQPKSSSIEHKNSSKSNGASTATSKKADKKASKKPQTPPSALERKPTPPPAASTSTPPSSKPHKTSRLDHFFKSSSSSSQQPPTTPNTAHKLQRPQSAGNVPKSPSPKPQIPATKPDFRPPAQIPATKPDYRPPQQNPTLHPPPSGRPASYYGPPVSTNTGSPPGGPAFPQPWSSGPTPPPPPQNGQSFYGSYAPHSGGGSYAWNPNPGYMPGPPPPPPPNFPAANSGAQGSYPGGSSKPASNLTTIAQGATTVAHGLMGLIGSRK